MVRLVKLTDHNIFWLFQNSLELGNHHGHDFLEFYFVVHGLGHLFLLSLEHFAKLDILLDDLAEYQDGHLFLQRRRDHLQEFFELVLLSFGALREDEEFSDAVLKDCG